MTSRLCVSLFLLIIRGHSLGRLTFPVFDFVAVDEPGAFFLGLSRVCVNADAATDFTLFGVSLADKSLLALDATFGEVFSFFANVASKIET